MSKHEALLCSAAYLLSMATETRFLGGERDQLLSNCARKLDEAGHPYLAARARVIRDRLGGEPNRGVPELLAEIDVLIAEKKP